MIASPAAWKIKTFGLVLCFFLIEASMVRLRTLSDLRLHIVETIATLLLTSLFYLLSAWLLLKVSQDSSRLRLRWIVLAAILFRATAFLSSPALTDDLYRYRWEGKLQSAGFNPYLTRPDDPRLAPLRDSLYPAIVGKEFTAVYGPSLELEERAWYGVVSRLSPDAATQLFWFKAVPAAADLGIIAVLIALLRVRGLPPERVLIYAWCPLPVLEFWASGHHDAIVLLLLMLAILWSARGREALAGTALSLAALAKFWPALLFPVFTGFRLRRIATAFAILACATIAVSWPYWGNVTDNVRFATGFLGGWRNNDSLHAIIAALTPDPYIAKYVTMALTGAAAVIIAALRWQVEARVLGVIVAILALSANVHPWYLTWIIPLLTLYPIPALLLWTALMPLAYSVLIDWSILGVWNGETPMRWLIYGPVAVMLLASAILRRRQTVIQPSTMFTMRWP